MRSTRGFTLIELMLVVVVIGILSSIAIPRYDNTRQRALVATMQSDLRDIAASQEAFLSESGGYYSGPVPAPGLLFSPSAGVAVVLANVSATGWAATATHPGTGVTCAIYHGTGGPLAPATTEGQVACN